MKASHEKTSGGRGFSLLETVIALGVLAVSTPLAFLALEQGDRSGMASAGDSRSGRMAAVCLEEVRASRDGRAQWWANTRPGDPIPPDGGFWALAFSEDGRVMGTVDAGQWATGVARLDGQRVRYLAGITSEPYEMSGNAEMRNVCIRVEEAATAPEEKRVKIEFHTLVP